MLRHRCRSRSPRPIVPPSLRDREALLAEFVRLYWEPPDFPDAPPWTGQRAAKLVDFRERLTSEAERVAAIGEDDDDRHINCEEALDGRLVSRWQRFVAMYDLARMSDVLFRGPIESSHEVDIDVRLSRAMRRVHESVTDVGEFLRHVAEFRVSAVNVAILLETSRGTHVEQAGDCEDLPDARTLAGLLTRRCGNDGCEEVIEMYRLLCQKLAGVACPMCGEGFDEAESAGCWAVETGAPGSPTASVPKVLVPQCGHAVHTACFGEHLSSNVGAGPRGRCRCCGASFGWTSIDIDPLLSTFTEMNRTYFDSILVKVSDDVEDPLQDAIGVARACQNLAVESNGLVTAATAWLAIRHRYADSRPEVVDHFEGAMLQLLPLLEAERPCDRTPLEFLTESVVIGPEDRSDADDDASCSSRSEGAKEFERHVVEVFLPLPQSEFEHGPENDGSGDNDLGGSAHKPLSQSSGIERECI